MPAIASAQDSCVYNGAYIPDCGRFVSWWVWQKKRTAYVSLTHSPNSGHLYTEGGGGGGGGGLY